MAAATAESIEKAIKAAFSTEPAAEKAPPEAKPDLDGLRAQVVLLENVLGGSQFAALLARLEQIAERDHHALNVLGKLLIDLGFITREDLRARLQKP